MRASDAARARFALAVLGVAAAVLSCQALVALSVEAPAVDGGAADAPAGTDADVEAPVDPCAPPPPPPSHGAPGDANASVPTLVFAAYEWSFDGSGNPELCAQPGFDLDGLDTGPPGVCTTNASCKQRPSSGAKLDNCDGPGGVDNNALNALRGLRQLPSGTDLVDQLETGIFIRRGVSNMLMELGDYNGLPDDDDIGIIFFSSAGMEGVPSVENMSLDEIRALPPVWDGGQDASWIVSASSVTTVGTVVIPKFVTRGYVRGGVLVVPKVPLGFGPPTLLSVGPEALAEGFLTARLVRDGDRYKLTHGRLGTSVANAALLSSLARIRYHSDQLLCATTDYPVLRDIACSALDLPRHGSAPDASVECGDMSVAFAFASITSRVAYVDGGNEDGGTLVLGRGFVASDIVPCPDDAGTSWCDDCDWEGPRRCEAGVGR